jgi:type I restriction enzyme S subunit
LPYTFDISIFTQIDNDDLIKHILRVGKTFYFKENGKLKTESRAKNNSQLPKGWEVKKLREVCEIEYGTRVVRKRDGGTIYPVYGGGGATFFMDIFNREDCLIVARFAMSEKCTRFVKGKFFLNDSGLSVKPKDIKDILQSFLNWQFLHLNDFIYSLSRGTAQKNLNVPIFRTIDIYYPKLLSEQKRIIAILDRTFKAIDQAKTNTEQNLKNAKELFESYLNRIFEEKGDDWEKKKLKDICEKITDGTHQTPKYFDDGVVFLSSKNVTSRKIDWKNVRHIDEKQHIEMHKRVAPKMGDVLLAKNGTTGVAAIVDRDIIFDIYVSLAWLRSKGEVVSEFLLHFINSPVAKKQFNKRLKGTGVPNLHLQEIREVLIYFPKSLETQKQIVAQLDQLQIETKKLETIYQQKINNLIELKKSILQKAFKGEL